MRSGKNPVTAHTWEESHLPQLPRGLCSQVRVLGTSAVTKVQGETEPEMSAARGKARLAACSGLREPSRGSASGALLASNLGKLWGSGGTSWESRGPGKRKKSSFPPFAAGNHEHLVTATW